MKTDFGIAAQSMSQKTARPSGAVLGSANKWRGTEIWSALADIQQAMGTKVEMRKNSLVFESLRYPGAAQDKGGTNSKPRILKGVKTAICTKPFQVAASNNQDYLSSLLEYCLGMITGCRLALAYISSTTGDFPSVRITVPIDMKNLYSDLQPIILSQ